MHPPELFPLFAQTTTLPGVGVKTAQYYKRLMGDKVLDVLYHMPISLVDRSHMPAITHMQTDHVVTAVVEVDQYMPPARPSDKKSPFKVRCFNETGFLTLVYFNAYPDFIKKILPLGQKRVISGKVERFGGEVQIPHPDYVVPVSQLKEVTIVEPTYPMAAGVTPKGFIKALHAALAKLPDLPEWIDPNFIKKQGWPSWKEALIACHNPKTPDDVEPMALARQRLAYDELLASQLALKRLRHAATASKGNRIKGDGRLRTQLLAALPFALTNGQQEVIKDIYADQESPHRMMRLLQGDVGSGKTVVALMAMLSAIEAGKQTALMVPTEILSRQHHKWISGITESLGIRIELLVGSVKGKKREAILHQLQQGDIDIVVGTHALFQDTVAFKELGLVVIDEQHRFGVQQRLSLSQKGDKVDTLLMTATPIPRTLTLAAYGDMECSRLTEKPKGRKAIDTRIISAKKIDNVLDGLGRAIEKDNKVYWICPLVEESEVMDLAAAEERYAEFCQLFGDTKVGLIHGRTPAQEREAIMLEFRDGKIDILVATTVIEVGVDVPNATIIVIEHAERFGLSQLHQLRGRVGRNDKQSTCVLMYHQLGQVSRKRLEIMRCSEDGFFLAEEDLKIRGGGEVLGTRQSGLPSFKVASLTEHYELLYAASDDAKLVVVNNPKLAGERGKSLAMLLSLFEYSGESQVNPKQSIG